ncbi:MAG: vWA domain-containing protein [Chloroflexota bacterium]|nr:vWA domain-containing protein [Chloroflexota bacterium]
MLIDNSWSMSREDPPSDPEELRIHAARFLVDYLRTIADTRGANYRVGVVSFGGEVSSVIPLRLLQDGTVRDDIHAEEIQFTDFRAPLLFTTQEFKTKSFGTGNKMAVILFTDGRPNMMDAPMSEQELLDYFEDLAPLVGELEDGGVSLFVLSIGDAEQDRDNWMRLIPEPQDRYIPIASTEELAGVYHRIVEDLIGVTEEPTPTRTVAPTPTRTVAPTPTRQEVFVEVEPYLEHIVFSFMKSEPTIHVTLTSPTGVVIPPTVGGTADAYHSIYTITSPDAGEWKASWEGEGQVQHWVERQHPLIRVEPIESPSLVGQPITIAASLVQNGVTVVDPDLRLEARITLPGGGVTTQALSSVGGGRHTGGYKDVEMEGTYTITATAFLDGQPLEARSFPVIIKVLPVTPTPTLPPSVPTPIPIPTATPIMDLILDDPIMIVSPARPRDGEPVRISVRISVPVEAAASPIPVTVRVTGYTMQSPITMTLVPEAGGFGGELGVLSCTHRYLPTCGRYNVAVSVQPEPPDGRVLQFEKEVKVRWSRWQDVACTMFIVALVGVIGRLLWRHRQKLSKAWCMLQIRSLKAAQSFIEALQHDKLIPAVLPATRLRRWREGLRRWHNRSSQQYAKLDVEPLYIDVNREVRRIEHQDIRAPEQLIQVREALDGLRPILLDQLKERIRAAKTASYIAGGQIAYFDKWLDVGSPVMAVEWLKKLATSCVQNEQIAAGWCLARLIEAGKWDLYFDLYRAGEIPYQVYEYETMVERFIMEGE